MEGRRRGGRSRMLEPSRPGPHARAHRLTGAQGVPPAHLGSAEANGVVGGGPRPGQNIVKQFSLRTTPRRGADHVAV